MMRVFTKFIPGMIFGALLFAGGVAVALQGIDLQTGNTMISTTTANAILFAKGGQQALGYVGPCGNNVPFTGSSTTPQCGGTIPAANGGTGAASIAGAQANLFIGTLSSAPVSVSFGTAQDNAIAIPLPTGYTQFRADSLVISQCSASLSGATFGLFTTTGGGGAAIITAGATSTITNNTANTNNNYQFVATNNASTEAYTASEGNIQLRVGATAASTCQVAMSYRPIM